MAGTGTKKGRLAAANRPFAWVLTSFPNLCDSGLIKVDKVDMVDGKPINLINLN